MMERCDYCDDTGWVCENHGDLPWDGVSSRFDACACGGAGAPCSRCNQSGTMDKVTAQGGSVICSVFDDGGGIQ